MILDVGKVENLKKIEPHFSVSGGDLTRYLRPLSGDSVVNRAKNFGQQVLDRMFGGRFGGQGSQTGEITQELPQPVLFEKTLTAPLVDAEVENPYTLAFHYVAERARAIEQSPEFQANDINFRERYDFLKSLEGLAKQGTVGENGILRTYLLTELSREKLMLMFAPTNSWEAGNAKRQVVKLEKVVEAMPKPVVTTKLPSPRSWEKEPEENVKQLAPVYNLVTAAENEDFSKGGITPAKMALRNVLEDGNLPFSFFENYQNISKEQMLIQLNGLVDEEGKLLPEMVDQIRMNVLSRARKNRHVGSVDGSGELRAKQFEELDRATELTLAMNELYPSRIFGTQTADLIIAEMSVANGNPETAQKFIRFALNTFAGEESALSVQAPNLSTALNSMTARLT